METCDIKQHLEVSPQVSSHGTLQAQAHKEAATEAVADNPFEEGSSLCCDLESVATGVHASRTEFQSISDLNRF